ncbi:hypothetical protein [Hymenobacter canadensis]|uniref:Anti sigma-E protein RseA N-terminal domain-containing protein n=1 Tax=Hymenobacter canadensis TaxID=2999067 RepID=A0ABY7LJV1_9BACT|nr:hypothetical protein [Hymenobacter canadensis]WBA40716.1 hypothetical protein O3303_12900 [Hymenobacter canadensis]
MSYDDPEEELLDQHLREAFSEFELPPARRVWNGIEGRIGTLPGASQPLVPLKFLLPAVVLAGVAAGWLLPRPTPTLPAAPAPATRTVAAQATPLNPGTDAAASVELVSAGPVAVAGTGRRLSAVPRPAGRRPVAVAPLASQLPPLATALDADLAAVLLSEVDSNAASALPVAPYTPVTPAVVPAPEIAQAPSATEAPRADGQQGSHTEFRQPTHRRAEKGRGIRRRLSAVGQWARHLVSPRRARTTGKPRF